MAWRPVLLGAVAVAVATAFAPTSWTVSTRVDGVVRRSPGLNRRLSGDVLGGLKWPFGGKKDDAQEDEDAPPPPPPPATDDITNTPVFLEKKLEVMKREAADLDGELAAVEAASAAVVEEWGPQIERMKAEFEAVKRRTADARKMAETVERVAVLDQILGVTDNFDRALAFNAKAEPESAGVAAIVERYATDVATSVDAAFDALGAEKIDAVGVAFDPQIHEAAMTAPDDDVPPDHVTKIFQYGMKVGDRLIRPATVVVSEG